MIALIKQVLRLPLEQTQVNIRAILRVGQEPDKVTDHVVVGMMPSLMPCGW